MKLRFTLVCIGLTLALVGCGKKDEGNANNSTPPPTTGGGPAPAAPVGCKSETSCTTWIGSAWVNDAKSLNDACSSAGLTVIAGACPTDGSVGICAFNKGTDKERTETFYSPNTASIVADACKAANGVLQ